MENNIYPIRSFIRFQAKQQLLLDAARQADAHSAEPREDLGQGPLGEGDSSAGRPVASLEEVPQPHFFDTTVVDNTLLKEISATLFNSDRHPELYRPCRDIVEATAIEEAIALDIVRNYRRIKQNQRRTDVQALNRLL